MYILQSDILFSSHMSKS